MTTQTHTPGEWTIRPGNTFDFAHPEIFSGDKRIAVVLWQNDARLIAAAPDLLAALQDLLAATAANYLPGIPELADAQHTAQAALAKAQKGEV